MWIGGVLITIVNESGGIQGGFGRFLAKFGDARAVDRGVFGAPRRGLEREKLPSSGLFAANGLPIGRWRDAGNWQPLATGGRRERRIAKKAPVFGLALDLR
jgi:hypothetical protein